HLVDLDDPGLDFVADLDDILDLGHVVFAELRDVDEAVDVVFELDEGAKAGDLGHSALDEVAHLETGVDFAPGILLKLLHPKADALVGLVDFQDHGLDDFALLHHLAGMVDLAGPAQVGDVDHAIDAILRFHEGPVGGEVADFALDGRTNGVAAFHFVPGVGLELANAEGDLLLFLADRENHGADFLFQRENVAGAGDALRPG